MHASVAIAVHACVAFATHACIWQYPCMLAYGNIHACLHGWPAPWPAQWRVRLPVPQGMSNSPRVLPLQRFKVFKVVSADRGRLSRLWASCEVRTPNPQVARVPLRSPRHAWLLENVCLAWVMLMAVPPCLFCCCFLSLWSPVPVVTSPSTKLRTSNVHARAGMECMFSFLPPTLFDWLHVIPSTEHKAMHQNPNRALSPCVLLLHRPYALPCPPRRTWPHSANIPPWQSRRTWPHSANIPPWPSPQNST